MGTEEGTFWDEHWVLYGNQFDNKLHILKKTDNVILISGIKYNDSIELRLRCFLISKLSGREAD